MQSPSDAALLAALQASNDDLSASIEKVQKENADLRTLLKKKQNMLKSEQWMTQKKQSRLNRLITKREDLESQLSVLKTLAHMQGQMNEIGDALNTQTDAVARLPGVVKTEAAAVVTQLNAATTSVITKIDTATTDVIDQLQAGDLARQGL